jgi:F0F1-type ATP synthase assembly protein I
MSMMKQRNKTTMGMLSEAMREVLPYTNLGWQLAATLGLFFGAGYLLDDWLDTGATMKVVLSVLGIIVGLVTFFRTVNHIQENKKNPLP